MACAVLDEGHTAMRLDDFVQHPSAQAAGLKRVHVLALRLYTTPVGHAINRALLAGCSPARPHPYPATVLAAYDGLQKLRTAAEQQSRHDAKRAAASQQVPPVWDGAAAGGADALSTSTLWRGVSDVHLFHELKQRGGTELGFVSASSSRARAEEFALFAPAAGEPAPFLLKIRADMSNGSDVSFLSVFPAEAEYVYPPCTFLEGRTSWEEDIVLADGEAIKVRVLEVVPRLGDKVIGM